MLVVDILLFVITLPCILLAIFVYLNNRKSITNISFSLFILNGALWAFAIVMFRLSGVEDTALLWDKLIYIAGIIFMPLFLAFSRAFPKEKIETSLFYKIIYLAPILVLVPLLLFSRLWIQEIVVVPGGNSVILGPAYLFWVIWFCFYMIWGFFILLSKYRRAQGMERIQLRYIFLGLLSTIMVAFPFNVVAPLLANYKLVWAGPLGLFVTMVFIAFAIMKYHLFEVKVILTEFLVVLIGVVALAQAFLSQTFQTRIVGFASFSLFCLIGYLLVRATHREIRAKEVLEQKVKERTKELREAKEVAEKRAKEVEERKEELEKFYQLTVGRELKMIELKKKIKEMEKRQ